MSFYIVFKNRDKSPILVTDEQAAAIAEAKEEGRQIKHRGSFIDPAIIGEIVSAEKLHPPKKTEEPIEPDNYKLAFIELMKASRGPKKVTCPDWVKKQHRRFVQGTAEWHALPEVAGAKRY